MNPLLILVLTLEEAPAPEDTKPGWIAFLIFMLLVATVVFLAYSLNKHLRKARANFDEREGGTPSTPS